MAIAYRVVAAIFCVMAITHCVVAIIFCVMAGLGPATHVFAASRTARRGWPGQTRP
jgi:hypothetical protein